MKKLPQYGLTYLRHVFISRQLECLFTQRSRLSTAKPIHPSKPKGHVEQVKRFVDFIKVKVIGGKGGDGSLAFTRLPKKEFAGPDGGDGGNGGHVIFTASPEVKSFNHLEPIIRGMEGFRGEPKNCYGAHAKHTEIKVPLGTIFNTEEGEFLTELDMLGDYYVGARGGAGGRGNKHFLSNEQRAPAKAERGAQGEMRTLCLELKTMAFAGLVGFPNAGKSTLLRAISRARPKVAAYPFTTLNPHVGMVQYEDSEQIADIPGLIQGAHQDQGLGISFLRHIERCSCLLFVIDLSMNEPWLQLSALKYELEQYGKGLSERPSAVIGNKMDLSVADENLGLLREQTNLPVIPVSAKFRTGTLELMIHLREMYDKVHEEKKALKEE